MSISAAVQCLVEFSAETDEFWSVQSYCSLPDALLTACVSRPVVSSSQQRGLPLWVKLLAVIIVAGLVFVVIKNMESDPASDIPEQIEINV